MVTPVFRDGEPVAARHIIGHFATPAVMGALGQAIPLPAEGATGLWGVNIQGTERPWAQTSFLSGGAGTHTRGWGQRVRLTVDEAAHVSVMAERTRAGAPGRDGGEAGRPGRVVLEGEQLEAKAAFGMGPGEELEPALPGGGGYGSR